MPTPRSLLRAWTLVLGAAVLLGLTFSVRAAQTPPAAASKVQAATNAAPAECELPKAVFVSPVTPEEGKDPFFPLSRRPYPVTAVTLTNVAPAAVPSVQLDLKGISGALGHRLAIINNRTLEEGEEVEVIVTSGRVRVVCKEIKDDSVRVLINGQERTLRLRPGS
jgi:hypothetical protein